jgi:limonene-1,2-epoxide hydrolase
LNVSHVDVLSVQHEFGIYGGEAGAHLLALLRRARMPTVTTLHAILERPDAVQARVFAELVGYSDRLVTMTEKGRKMLCSIYGVAPEKIVVIPHGIPDWKNYAEAAFDWFLGVNDLGLPLYDAVSGGCFDGLHESRVNENQGAESTLAFLISLAHMRFQRDATASFGTEASIQ